MNLRFVKILSISSQTRHKWYSNLSIGNVSKVSIHGKFRINADHFSEILLTYYTMFLQFKKNVLILIFNMAVVFLYYTFWYRSKWLRVLNWM